MIIRVSLLLLAVILFAGCKKKPATVASTPATLQTTATTSANTNYDPNAGTAQNIHNAAKRVVTQAQMTVIGVFIDAEYGLNSKMPSEKTILSQLQREAPDTYKMIQDGTIKLSWTASHEGLWAYEVDAQTRGGIVLVTGLARRADADEVKRLLGR
ncbi:MAG: hypothetical protein ACRC8S_06295 [Fimbriiglobus sp.]